MRLRYKLILLVVVSALPFVAAMPWALREVQQVFDRELDSRLDGAERATRAAIDDLGAQVERAVKDLALDPAVEEIARGLLAGELDRAELVPLAERLMTLAGLDALEILDAEGRILSSGHMPARAGDPDSESLERSRQESRGAVLRRIEVRSQGVIAPALALVAARPVDYGSVRLHVIGGRVLGPDWARRLADLTGTAVSVSEGQRELARTAKLDSPQGRRIALGAGSGPIGAIQVELSDAGLRAARARVLRGSALLGAVLLAAAMVLGAMLAARITRPVDALAGGARALARGELGHEVRARASGELEELIEVFNAMSRDLRSATEHAAIVERIAAWQGVARRLAHEIKNPLTPIKLSVETLLIAHRSQRADFDEIFEESAQAVLEEVERLRRIVDEFSRFARLPKPRLEPVDLFDLAQAVLSLYSSPREGIRIERRLEAGIQVQADRDQISQLLINLLTNAEQAMPDGGVIVVQVCSDENGAALEVRDEGPGIRPEDHAGLFDPYFTTKEGGTGLGLAIALRIAQEHGGTLEELGIPGQGARFRLWLPRAGRPRSGAGTEAAS